jgi:hypothetical protein
MLTRLTLDRIPDPMDSQHRALAKVSIGLSSLIKFLLITLSCNKTNRLLAIYKISYHMGPSTVTLRAFNTSVSFVLIF